MERRAEFRELLAGLARYLYDFAVTKTEKSVCKELMRGRALSIDGLETLVDLAGRADNPMVLEETLRSAVLRRLAAPKVICAFEASELEQEANHPLNIAQLLAAREKSPIRWTQVLETARQQLFATRRLIDAAVIHIERAS